MAPALLWRWKLSGYFRRPDSSRDGRFESPFGAAKKKDYSVLTDMSRNTSARCRNVLRALAQPPRLVHLLLRPNMRSSRLTSTSTMVQGRFAACICKATKPYVDFSRAGWPHFEIWA